MEIKAGQFNEKLLTAAYQAVKNGSISEKDLTALAEAAKSDDGQLSDEERTLIANLANQQVQGALKQAVEGKGLVFKKYEFNKEVVFHLDESDKTLKVGNKEVPVADLENRPVPAMPFDLGRKRENYLARQQNQTESPQIQFGIKSIDAGTQQSAQDVHALLQQYKPVQGSGGPAEGGIDAAQIQQIDLQKDLNLTYMLVMTKANQIADMQDPIAKQQLGDFEHLLKQLNRGKTPDANEIKLLQAFGLDFKNGGLINTANQQPVTASQLEDLKKTAHAANKAGQTRGRVWEENKDAKVLVANLNVTQAALDQLDLARKEYLAAEQGVKTARQDVEVSISDVETKTQVAQQQQQQMNQTQELFNVLNQALQGADTGHLDQVLLRLRDLNPEQLKQLNQLLSKFHLEIKQDPQTHTLGFVKEGKPVSGAEFFKGVQSSLPDLRRDLEQQKMAFVKAQSDLQASTEKLDLARTHLVQATQTFSEKGQQYDQARSQADQAMASSSAMMTDPAIRAQMSPDMLARYDQLKARFDQGKQEYAADLSRRQPLLDSAQASLSRAERVRANAHALIASMNQMLAGLDKSFADLEARLEELSSDQSQTDSQADALVEQADQLEAQLNLMPAPIYQGVDQLLDQFKQLLADSRTHFSQLTRNNDTREGFATRLTRENIDKIDQELKHHEQALNSLDKHNKELVARYLAQSLGDFQKLMAASTLP